MEEFTEHFIDTDEIDMHYTEGPDNGPPLVLIPSQGADLTTYEKVLPLFSEDFYVFAVDVRGHGKSDWATGNYTFNSIGGDMVALLEGVVKRPAIISGNSSGGLIALWLTANRPDLVSAAILEDPPLFSAEWPRIKEEYVYRVLQITVEMIEELRESRSIGGLARQFMKMKRPTKTGDMRSLPKSLAYLISFLIRASQRLKSGRPSLPGRLGTMLKMMMTFDPDFSQAFLDGRIYEGLDHADALQHAECPMLLLHANWHRHPDYGLIGAMDDDDARQARELAPDMQYKRIDSDHVIHSHEPEVFVDQVREFVTSLPHFQAISD
ncbi:alpha/beta fold hydrolase [Candidatus Thorarchaeota archaeon]|nr:MAG: alpha/beta fold hydrolase [Candidatus Thorarchaeota archaeon]